MAQAVRIPRLLCVVVTYNEAFATTRAGRSLSELPLSWREKIEICCVANEGSIRCDSCEVPDRTDGELAQMPLVSLATRCNGGLALGYNLALNELQHSTSEYVLFLNSDSEVQVDLLEGFRQALAKAPPGSQAAFAPRLVSDTLVVSPFYKPGFAHEFHIIGFMFCHRSLFPATFRFPGAYWLDGIDYWLSHQLAVAGVAVFPIERTVGHKLSVADGFGSLSGWRYRNIITSELRFLREFHAPLHATLQVIVRAVGRCLLKARPELIPEVWYGLLASRRKV